MMDIKKNWEKYNIPAIKTAEKLHSKNHRIGGAVKGAVTGATVGGIGGAIIGVLGGAILLLLLLGGGSIAGESLGIIFLCIIGTTILGSLVGAIWGGILGTIGGVLGVIIALATIFALIGFWAYLLLFATIATFVIFESAGSLLGVLGTLAIIIFNLNNSALKYDTDPKFLGNKSTKILTKMSEVGNFIGFEKLYMKLPGTVWKPWHKEILENKKYPSIAYALLLDNKIFHYYIRENEVNTTIIEALIDLGMDLQMFKDDPTILNNSSDDTKKAINTALKMRFS